MGSQGFVSPNEFAVLGNMDVDENVTAVSRIPQEERVCHGMDGLTRVDDEKMVAKIDWKVCLSKESQHTALVR